MNTNILESITELRASADEAIDNTAPIQVPAAMSVGDGIPQGDIVLIMQDALPFGAQLIPWPESGDFQLAPGNTKGSRHCIPRKFKDVVRVYRVDYGSILADTAIEADGPFDLVHPEHADHLGYSAEVYRVQHQQNAAHTRVID